jgi:hypothetical protein
MKATLTVYSEEEYKNWQVEMQERAKHVNDKDNADNYWGWKWVASN